MGHDLSSHAARDAIDAKARALGFDAVGIARAKADTTQGQALQAFIADGRHGDMEWMQSTQERRSDPIALWPEAVSAVVVGVNYAPFVDPLAALGDRGRGVVSAYAQTGRDYHDVLKKKLRVLARWISEEFDCGVKLFVDTAPVMEKPLAARAGLGWQGKHTNLVSRDFGSWLFLGEILTTIELPPDTASYDACGTCRRCMDICPTAAFPAPYQLDARRCIAYLTNEFRGHIPLEFRTSIGNRVFGCDDCLAVCPWNKFAIDARDTQMAARPELANLRLADLVELNDQEFREVFYQSPVKRLGRDCFVRNVLIAIGNSDDATLIPAATRRLEDEAPVVRAMAVWALSQLLGAAPFRAIAKQHVAGESDGDVLHEWKAGLAPQAVSGKTGGKT